VIAVDVTSDDEGAKKFIAEKKITFRSLRGDWTTALAKYGVNGTPSNFIIDQKGRVLFVHNGFRGPEGVDQMANEIEALLARP
jgi:peroxiredoxin